MRPTQVQHRPRLSCTSLFSPLPAPLSGFRPPYRPIWHRNRPWQAPARCCHFRRFCTRPRQIRHRRMLSYCSYLQNRRLSALCRGMKERNMDLSNSGIPHPIVVETHSRKMDTRAVLNKCLWAVGLISGLAFFFALFFPNFILKFLTGHSQPEAVSLVKYFALSMAFFALGNILMLYHLSLRNMKFIYFLLH